MNSGAKDVRRERVLKGQCPNCGKEAAPYRLCWNCRSKLRFNRALKRGERFGVIQFIGDSKRLTKDTLVWKGAKFDDKEASKEWGKWQTPFVLPDSDSRGKPRLRGIRVDVEATLVEVVKFIGRPCTLEEILAAWGRLRERRNSPLASDLATIIAASDKRKRRGEKLAAIHARQANRA